MKQALKLSVIFLCFISSFIAAKAQNISTLAGGIGDGGSATNATINSPVALCTDRFGNVYVADYNYNTIRKITPSGILTHFAGVVNSPGYSGDRGLAIYAQLDRPVGVVADTSGNIYVAEYANQRVRKISPQGVITTFVSLTRNIYAITIDDNQFIYIATSDQRVYKITPTGYMSIFANTSGISGYYGDGGYAIDAGFNKITSMCTDHAGNLYLLDVNSNNIRIIYPSGIINTFAGDSFTGYAGDGGMATAARINSSSGISSDNSGNIYVADKANQIIRKINTSGIINTIAGRPGISGNTGDGGVATSAKFNYPYQAVTDAAGNIYVADYNNKKIRKIDPAGIVSTFAGTNVGVQIENLSNGGPAKSAILNQPMGAHIDTLKNIYFTETGINNVRKIDAAGIITKIAGKDSSGFSGDGGPATNAKFNKPTSVVKDARGNVYICDMLNRRIRKINPAGIITTYAGGGIRPLVDGARADTLVFPTIFALGIDKVGNVYVSTGGSQIKKIDTNRIIITVCGTGVFGYSGDGGPATSAQIGDILGMALDANGRIFIADYAANRIRVIDTSGIITTFAGQGSAITSGDGGAATLAGIPSPNGVVVDKDGNVYISSANYIRKVNAAGIITKYGGLPSGTTADDQPATASYISSVGGNQVGMAVDSVGNLVFADIYQSKIKIIYNAGISIGTPVITYCTPTSATFTATATAAPGITLRYRWYLNGYPVGTDSFKYTSTPLHDSDIVYCNITNGANPTVLATSNKITIKIHPFPLTATVSMDITPYSSWVCVGTTVTCTPIAVNGGTSPIYYWYKNNTLSYTGPIYRFVPVNGDVVYCKMRSNEYCLFSDTVISSSRTFVVNARTYPYVYVNPSLDSVPCPRAVVTADPVVNNAGGTVTYEWYRNNIFVANTFSYRFVPAENDSIFCKVRIANGCLLYDTAISPKRHFHMKKPIVYITSSNGLAICPGSSTSLLATNLQGGTTPVYHWYKNGVLVYTGNPYLAYPNVGDSIYCQILSSIACILNDSAKSNTLHYTTPIYRNPGVTVTPTKGTSICPGADAYFIAASVNGGTTPNYKWYVNDKDTVRMVGSTFLYAPKNGDIVRCLLTSNATCLNRDTAWSSDILMTTTIPDTASITITSDIGNEFCIGTRVNCTLSDRNAGTSPKYAWYVNNNKVSSATTYSRIPNNDDEIYCTLTNDISCLANQTVTSNIIKFKVNSKASPKVTIDCDPGVNLCGPTEVTCTANGENTGDAPEYTWRLNGEDVGLGTTYTFTPEQSDQINCVLNSNQSCITTNTAVSSTLQFGIYDHPSVSIASDIGPVVYRGSNVTLSARVNGRGIDDYEVIWYVNGAEKARSKSTEFASSNFNDWDSVYCIVNYEGVCSGSVQSNTILINTYHNLKLYPNPGNGDFTISLNDYSVNGANVTIEVYDMMAQKVHSENTQFNLITLYQQLKLSEKLPSGVYLLKVNYEKTKLSKTFVVKH